MTDALPITLDDVCEFIVDCLHKTAPLSEEGYPSIRTPNVGKGRLKLEGVNRVSEATYREWTKRAIPQTNDLILAREAPAGNVAIVKDGQVVCLGQRTVHLRPDPEKTDPDFLCYFLLAPRQRGNLLAGETGATAGHVNMRDIRRLPLIDLPPIQLQRKIGQLLSAYDDLIENNRRRIAVLEQAARLLYREWFVHFRFPGFETAKFIDGLPEGWERIPFSDAAFVNKKTVWDKNKNRDIRMVPMGALSESGMTCDSSQFEKREKPTGVKFVNGDTLFARITPCLENGKTAYVDFLGEDEVACGSTEFIVFREHKLSRFMIYLLAREDGFRQNAVTSMVGSSGRQRVQNSCFDKFMVSIPPKEIATEFDQKAGPMFNQVSALLSSNQRLAKARDLLLPRLMDGRLPIPE